MKDEFITEKFGKYTVTLELFEEDGEQRSYCDIESNTGGASSLGFALDMGFLMKSHEREEKISNSMLSQIEKWALDNGY
jgi:hypothetical protein